MYVPFLLPNTFRHSTTHYLLLRLLSLSSILPKPKFQCFIQVFFTVALTLAYAAAAPQNVLLRAVPFGSVPTLAQPLAAAPLVRTVASAPTVVSPVTTPVVAPVAPRVEVEEVNIDPSYQFGYTVTDAKTGDSKAREEVRDGDVVSGSYTVADPDGRIRHVQYTADAVNGFNAVVTYDGEQGPPAIPTNPIIPSTVDTTPVVAQVATPAATPAATPVIQAVRTQPRVVPAVTQPLLRTPQVVAAPQLVNPAIAGLARTRSHVVDPTTGAVHAIDHHVAHAPTATFLRNADGSLTPFNTFPVNAPFLNAGALPLLNAGILN